MHRLIAAVFMVACIVLASVFLTPSPGQAAASVTCDRLPHVVVGQSPYLGPFGSVALRCRIERIEIVGGVRYPWSPRAAYAIWLLRYEHRISPNLRLTFAGSSREMWGDYEVSRAPEIALLWDSWHWGMHLTLEATAGSYQNVSVGVGTWRTGQRISLTSPPLPLSSSSRVTLAGVLGWYQYGTGDSHRFWSLSGQWTTQLSPSASISLGYSASAAGGRSPLAFDAVGTGQTLSPAVQLRLDDMNLVSIGVALDPSPRWAATSYALSWTRSGLGTISATWRLSDGRILLSFSSGFLSFSSGF